MLVVDDVEGNSDCCGNHFIYASAGVVVFRDTLVHLPPYRRFEEHLIQLFEVPVGQEGGSHADGFRVPI